MIRRKELYALVIPRGADPEEVAQEIVQRWVGQDYSPFQRGFRHPRIVPPPAGLRLALTQFCKDGANMVVDTREARPVTAVWTPACGVQLSPRILEGRAALVTPASDSCLTS